MIIIQDKKLRWVLDKAASFESNKRYKQCISFLNKYRKYRNISRIQSLYGFSYMHLRRYKLAIYRFEKAIRLRNYRPEIFLYLDYVSLAICHDSTGDFKAAKRVLEKGLRNCKEKTFLSGALKIVNKKLKMKNRIK
ncbi:MAG TPA: tetratricopeptide repeat protein [Candidatus Goldiibacteriota bacterium]|nr:tetratricopeptide repeat protein [Candidatus Goldiibacteriota bacterium]HRQ43506.1 tetratricopeptide repeat protein [Candidatus Goldiibacteriota bacterium]